MVDHACFLIVWVPTHICNLLTDVGHIPCNLSTSCKHFSATLALAVSITHKLYVYVLGPSSVADTSVHDVMMTSSLSSSRELPYPPQRH